MIFTSNLTFAKGSLKTEDYEIRLITSPKEGVEYTYEDGTKRFLEAKPFIPNDELTKVEKKMSKNSNLKGYWEIKVYLNKNAQKNIDMKFNSLVDPIDETSTGYCLLEKKTIVSCLAWPPKQKGPLFSKYYQYEVKAAKP